MLHPPPTVKSWFKVHLGDKIFVFINAQTIQRQQQIILIISA
jgi:hypothetical protein